MYNAKIYTGVEPFSNSMHDITQLFVWFQYVPYYPFFVCGSFDTRRWGYTTGTPYANKDDLRLRDRD